MDRKTFKSVDLDEIIAWYATHARVRMTPERTPALAGPGLRVDDRLVGRIRVARSSVPAGLTLTTTSTDVYALTTVHAGSLQVGEAADRWRITPATAGGVGVRSLQQGFRDHVGMSPLAYLRRVRLARVRDELRQGADTTVAEAAHRWGFTHLGRFAAAYAGIYGVTPSTTLSNRR